jgi:hypothetical protein
MRDKPQVRIAGAARSSSPSRCFKNKERTFDAAHVNIRGQCISNKWMLVEVEVAGGVSGRATTYFKCNMGARKEALIRFETVSGWLQ